VGLEQNWWQEGRSSKGKQGGGKEQPRATQQQRRAHPSPIHGPGGTSAQGAASSIQDQVAGMPAACRGGRSGGGSSPKIDDGALNRWRRRRMASVKRCAANEMENTRVLSI
jgi:hypothetical protein